MRTAVNYQVAQKWDQAACRQAHNPRQEGQNGHRHEQRRQSQQRPATCQNWGPRVQQKARQRQSKPHPQVLAQKMPRKNHRKRILAHPEQKKKSHLRTHEKMQKNCQLRQRHRPVQLRQKPQWKKNGQRTSPAKPRSESPPEHGLSWCTHEHRGRQSHSACRDATLSHTAHPSMCSMSHACTHGPVKSQNREEHRPG